MFELITPLSYWILTFLWLVILWLFLARLRQTKGMGGAVSVLLSILAIDAFRTVFESIYFGLYFNSRFGLLPISIHDVLAQPAMLIIPKLLNVAAGLLVLFLLVRRWVPREIRQREERIDSLQKAKRVAEHKKDEAERQFSKFEAIFNGINDVIIFTDTERRIVSTNLAMKNMFGYTIEDLAGKTTNFLYESSEEFERQGRIRYNLSAEEKSAPYEMNYKRNNGEVFVGETLGAVIHGAKGDVLGFVGLIRDITDRKLAKEKLLEAKEDAENANKAKSEFLTSMSHELRTPLNAILGFAQLLQIDRDASLSPAQKGYVENVLDGGNHLLCLVDDILDLAKIEADQLVLVLEEVSANDLVEDCVSMTGALGEPRGIWIDDRFSDGSTVYLHTDQMRLKQALINVLSNAIKFNKDGGTVTINGAKTEEGFLRISITDTGTGIALQDRHNVFNMFHRLGSDPLIATEGTGIGLSVTKLLVERLAGRIGFDSEVGVGSTFWIELPLLSNKEALIWTDAQRIGIDTLDKDHQVLISLLNKVSLAAGDDADLIDPTGKLIDYIHYHFRREEAIMKVCRYPGLDRHRSHRQNMSAQINTFADAWHKNYEPQSFEQLRKVLHDLLFDDIMKVDADLIGYTQGKGEDIRKALESVKQM